MTESLVELLEKMRASRAALGHELNQIPTRTVLGAQLAQSALTSKGLNIAIAAVVALVILVPWRRR
jgi:hypothetical protein